MELLPATASALCPAKVNLTLAITGRRTDSFHDLVSLVAQVAAGDQLTATWSPAEGEDSLTCDDPTLPTDTDNLILQAAALLRIHRQLPGHFRFTLTKKLPAGAGLGGGSSDGVAALGLMQKLRPEITDADVRTAAQALGSDCPLFLDRRPKVMRGRGERLSPLPLTAAQGLRGQTVILARPSFGVSTPWAYRELAARAAYTSPARAETQVFAWRQALQTGNPLNTWLEPADLANDFLPLVAEKYLSLAVLLETLNHLSGVVAGMSGSGSAIFVLPAHHVAARAAQEAINAAWGDAVWMQATRFL